MLSGCGPLYTRKKSTPYAPGESVPQHPPNNAQDRNPSTRAPAKCAYISGATNNFVRQHQTQSQRRRRITSRKAKEAQNCFCLRRVYSSASAATSSPSPSLSISMPTSSVVLSPCISISLVTVTGFESVGQEKMRTVPDCVRHGTALDKGRAASVRCM